MLIIFQRFFKIGYNSTAADVTGNYKEYFNFYILIKNEKVLVLIIGSN